MRKLQAYYSQLSNKIHFHFHLSQLKNSGAEPNPKSKRKGGGPYDHLNIKTS